MITTLHEETAYWSFEGGLIRCRIELSMGLFWGRISLNQFPAQPHNNQYRPRNSPIVQFGTAPTQTHTRPQNVNKTFFTAFGRFLNS